MLDEAASGRATPVIVVHTFAHAVGALRAAAHTGRPIVLSSAPEAGASAGPGWFRELIAAAREAVPDASFSAILDCGEEPGPALAAIRAGVERVLFTGRADVALRLADIARQHGVRLETAPPSVALDLADAFFATDEQVEQQCLQLPSLRSP
jgi:acyl-CoA reductase-like NAD-dependent aldehyde dehydrogenase